MPLLAVLCWIATIVHAEEPLIPENVVVETVSTGEYQFTEGPALAPDGSIYFSDIPNDSIHRYDPATGETTLFTDDSGGANGLMFFNGSLYACLGKSRGLRIYAGTIMYASAVPGPNSWSGIRSEDFVVMATHHGGKRLNSPNDIAVSRNGFVYFTDPRYGNRDSMELEVEGIYTTPQVNVPLRDFKGAVDEFEEPQVIRLIDRLVRPNGIGVSFNKKTLYVNDNGDKKIWAYEILEPGKLGEAKLLNDLADLGGPDGMAVGPRGRIYTAIYGKGVLILSPEGKRLGFIETGPQTTNCAFGADGVTLYVTAEKSLKRVVLNTGGTAQE